MKKASKRTSKLWVDNLGREVPASYVPRYDKLRDRAVRKVHAAWVKQRQALEQCLAMSVKELNAVLKARSKDTKMTLAEKGNFQVSSFDGSIVVSMEQNYRILLDDRVKEAQAIMEAYADKLISKIEGLDAQALAILIRGAFSAQAGGTLSTAKVMQLCRMDIPAADWQRARQLLYASMQPIKGKQYLRVGMRASIQHKYEYLRLDIADCWPEEVGSEK